MAILRGLSSDPYPWFSHQHDARFDASGAVSMFDNGNTRVSQSGGNSRGMVLSVDEGNRTVTPVISVDLGGYSSALGSAQRLSNGNYHFGSGLVGGSHTSARRRRRLPESSPRYSTRLRWTIGSFGCATSTPRRKTGGFAGASKDVGQHLLGQLAGRRILLAGVVGANQQRPARHRAVLNIMAEDKRRAAG